MKKIREQTNKRETKVNKSYRTFPFLLWWFLPFWFLRPQRSLWFLSRTTGSCSPCRSKTHTGRKRQEVLKLAVIRLERKECCSFFRTLLRTTMRKTTTMKNAHPGQALVLLSLRVLQPLHQLRVPEQVSVQWAVLGQGQLCCVLRQRWALIMTLQTHTHTHTRNVKARRIRMSEKSMHTFKTGRLKASLEEITR